MKIYKLIQELKKMYKEHGNLDVGYYSGYGTFLNVNSVNYSDFQDAMDTKQKECAFVHWKPKEHFKK